MILKGRLKLIADMAPECNIACDIGTDHAYVPIYLVKNSKCKKAIACDVKKGPIDLAIKNIGEHKLSSSIITRIGSGLDPLHEDEMDVVIIAGMGGMLIKEILTSGFEKAKKANTLVLQPMNSIELAREWLYENGFCIYNEGLVKEGFKIYNVIAAKWDGYARKVDEVYYYIGEKLIEDNNSLLERYVENKINQMDKIISGMDKMKHNDCNEKDKFINIRNGLVGILKNIGGGIK